MEQTIAIGTANIEQVQKNRIETFDIARGIGILLMVMGHTGFGFEFSRVIHTFHMPLFFFVSGFFYRPQKFAGYWDYLRHEARTLIVPYLIFAVFYEFLHYLFSREFSINYFLLSVVSSNHNRIDVAGALWFLLCLFSAKAVYHALTLIIKDTKTITVTVVVISLTASFLRTFGVILPFALDSALSCQLLIHIGYLLYKYREKPFVRRLFNMTWWMLIIVVIVFFVATFANEHVNVRRNKYGILPLYLLSCYSGIFLTMNISSLLDKGKSCISTALCRMLSYWGRESIVFLLLNELILYIVSTGFSMVGILNHDTYWEHGVEVIISMSLLSFTAFIVSKTHLRYLFGKK